jgi:hypothetical protein
MGHAISGGGFFNINVEPVLDVSKAEVFAAVINFKDKALSEEQLSSELKHLMDDLWDWQVRKLSETEFGVSFPSRETLRMTTRSGRLFLPLSQSDVGIHEAFLEPKPGKAFPTAWVQLTGIPTDLLEVDRLMAAMTMIGRPLEVDVLSLRKWETEPIRMRF